MTYQLLYFRNEERLISSLPCFPSNLVGVFFTAFCSIVFSSTVYSTDSVSGNTQDCLHRLSMIDAEISQRSLPPDFLHHSPLFLFFQSFLYSATIYLSVLFTVHFILLYMYADTFYVGSHVLKYNQ